MAEALSGMPLLSGPLPEMERDGRTEASCRKCNKEFNILFTRSRRCNHCGYTYCHSCTDFQALMPRNWRGLGYDPVHVCAFCVQYLSITAGGKGYLRSLPLARLKNYIQSYNIRIGPDVIEKDDLINRIIAAREPNGCLPARNENYYRKHSVPNGQTEPPRTMFSGRDRARPIPRQNLNQGFRETSRNTFARPDLEQLEVSQEQQSQRARQWNGQPPPHYTSPPGPPPGHSLRPQSRNFERAARTNDVPPRPTHAPSPTTLSRGAPTPTSGSPHPTPTSYANNFASRSQTQTPRTPTLEELLQMDESEIGTLSVGTLKAVLMENHVAPGIVLEKGELVSRVYALLESERREREHMAAVHELEDLEAQDRESARYGREHEAWQREHGSEGRRRRREAFRTTVEIASESEESLQERIQGTEPQGILEQMSSPRSSAEPEQSAPSPSPKSEDQTRGAKRSKSPSASPDRNSFHRRSERTGLCVVCQDEEANMVIVDCGHLALCRTCANLVWSTSRECPLCRTRIVTEQRLLRIFKT